MTFWKKYNIEISFWACRRQCHHIRAVVCLVKNIVKQFTVVQWDTSLYDVFYCVFHIDLIKKNDNEVIV